MPSVDIVSTVDICRTPRLIQVEGMFDLTATKVSQFKLTAKLPIEEKAWQIGLIVGPSGSGKSTVARQLFGDHLAGQFQWPEDKSVVDGFPSAMSIKDVVGLLSSVGFSSPPAWQRPYRCLSNGEQFRATLARSLAESDFVVFDEYSSVVDRTVAQIGSAAVAKTIRRTPAKKFVAVSCHYDVEEWLQPDWTYDPSANRFAWRSLRRRPEIRLEIVRANTKAWELFRRHHYLSETIGCATKIFVGHVENRPATFTAVMSFAHPIKPMWREHRTICLPDFQGVGLGNAMSEFVASVFKATGKPYMSITSHPAMIRHRAKSPLWRMTRKPALATHTSDASRMKFFGRQTTHERTRQLFKKKHATNRLTASFEYVGPARKEEAKGFGLM